MRASGFRTAVVASCLCIASPVAAQQEVVDIGADGTEQFQNKIRRIYRYRLTNDGRLTDYACEMNTAASIAPFLAERQ